MGGLIAWRRPFWYLMALIQLVLMNPSEEVTDAEYAWYQAFMRRHGVEP